MFRNGDFTAFFAPPEGYKAKELILFSYSLNLEVLDEVIRKSGIISFDKDPSKMKQAFEEAEGKIVCYVQENRRTGKLEDNKNTHYAYELFLRGIVKPVEYQNEKSFHPKLWAMLFQNVQNDQNKSGISRLRLIISSRNLSKQDMVEGCLVLETETFSDMEREELSDLRGLLEELSKKYDNNIKRDIVTKICTADFSECINSFLPEGMELKKYGIYTNEHIGDDKQPIGLRGLFPANVHKTTIVSPFLGADSLKKVISNRDYYVITRRASFTKDISETCGESHFYCLKANNSEKKDDIGSDGDIIITESEEPIIKYTQEKPLHAKIYGFDNEGESWIFIGSANCSEKGIEAQKNYEILLMIHVKLNNGDGFAVRIRDSIGDLEKLEKPYESKESEFPLGDNFVNEMSDEEIEEAKTAVIKEIINEHVETREWEILGDICGVSPRSNEKVVDYVVRCIKASESETIKEILKRSRIYTIEQVESERLKEILRELHELAEV